MVLASCSVRASARTLSTCNRYVSLFKRQIDTDVGREICLPTAAASCPPPPPAPPATKPLSQPRMSPSAFPWLILNPKINVGDIQQRLFRNCSRPPLLLSALSYLSELLLSPSTHLAEPLLPLSLPLLLAALSCSGPCEGTDTRCKRSARPSCRRNRMDSGGRCGPSCSGRTSQTTSFRPATMVQ